MRHRPHSLRLMLARAVRASSIALLLLLACSTCRATTILNFDDLSISGCVTFPGDHYAVQGVLIDVFSLSESTSTVVCSNRSFGNCAVSQPNSIVVFDSGLRGNTRMRFVDPTTGNPATTNTVSAMVGDCSGEQDRVVMTAYGLNGSVLDASTYQTQPTGDPDFGLVSISAPGIHRVEFFAAPGSSGADIDDFTFGPLTTVAVGREPLPDRMVLYPCDPNPFRVTTTVRFLLRAESDVSLTVHDVAGRTVATLIEGERLPAGEHAVRFHGAGLPPGLFSIRLKSGGSIQAARKVLLVR